MYLAPEPPGPFKELVRLVAGRYPECPPYGGDVPLDVVTPHLTAAHTADQSVLDRAAEGLAPRLPIAALAREVWLTEKPEGGRWRTRAVFPLGGLTGFLQ